MNSTRIKFGIYGLLAALGMFLLMFLVGSTFSYSVQEALGYLTIVVSLLFVYFGIKHYRDKENQGNLSFRDGIWIGLTITLFVAIGSGIADYIYVTILNPDFVTEYTAYQLEELRKTVPPSEFEIQSQEMLAQIERLGRPSTMALVMFMTVIIIGVIITVLSSLLLRSKT